MGKKKRSFKAQQEGTPSSPDDDGNGHPTTKLKPGNRNQQHVRETDPLKIKLIRETIFVFCSVDTLKNVRLVSTQWRDDSMEAWRDKAVLHCCPVTGKKNFGFDDYCKLMLTNEEDDNATVMLRNLKKYPFRRFNLALIGGSFIQPLKPIAKTARYLLLNSTFPTELPQLGKFLKDFRSLEDLRLGFMFNDSYYDPRKDYFSSKVKSLEVLQLPSSLAEIRKHLILSFPNLECLSLQFAICHDCNSPVSASLEKVKSILETLKGCRQNVIGPTGHVMPLKDLKICIEEDMISKYGNRAKDALNTDITRTIVRCKFPLRKLTLSLDLGWKDLQLLLLSCKDTLQYLKASLYFDVDSKLDAPNRSISMGKLTEAVLGCGHYRALFLLTHLELPNMKKLTIEEDKSAKKTEVGNRQLSFPPGRVYAKLEVLEFHDKETTPSPKTIETIARMMPNLVHLTIPLDKKTFPIVCEKLKGLTMLHILSARARHEELNDESLTGVTKEMGEGGSKPPNITDLANLMDLNISCDSQLLGNDVKFTDHSVIHGFLQLPRLYSLSIAFKKLSEDTRAKLMSHVKGNVFIQEQPATNADNLGVDIANEIKSDPKTAEQKARESEQDSGN